MSDELRAEIERLRAQLVSDINAEDEIDRLEAKLTEAAAFLDRVAEHLDKWLINEQFSADCRAMAKRLRGET